MLGSNYSSELHLFFRFLFDPFFLGFACSQDLKPNSLKFTRYTWINNSKLTRTLTERHMVKTLFIYYLPTFARVVMCSSLLL
ncbi:hypothetical protein Sjap_018092 [Stephania japonica]|uniref:Uncharacterized protein n=1 Tax=Stephania japonica TaxID=461633 RepID=A0AAP0NIZ7_9MAGN